jgi:hypothetical protein
MYASFFLLHLLKNEKNAINICHIKMCGIFIMSPSKVIPRRENPGVFWFVCPPLQHWSRE